MNQQLKNLISLQRIEIEIGTTHALIAANSQKVEALDYELTAFGKSVDEKKSLVMEMQKQYRLYESDLQADASRIRKSEITLGSIKTNREYQAILKEIEEIKAKTSGLEDVILENLEKIDEMEADIVSKQTQYHTLEESTLLEEETIEKEKQSAEKKLEKLSKERQRVSQTLDPKIKQDYEAIKNRLNGIAVAPVKASVCKGCHMNIPPQMFNELQQRGDLTFCPHCQRMIYWEYEEAAL
jgi:predicted  nucleic acid-binding Zn-ribbon protein